MGPDADTVLDLEARRRIVAFVATSPGLHLRALAEALAMPVSTLEYHCYHLARHGILATREQGGFKSFYPGAGMDRRDKDILSIIRHKGPRAICTHLILHPGTTPGELRDVVGLSGPTLSFHLKKLRIAGLLREEAAGRTKRLYVDEAERVASVLVTYKKSFLDEAVDRFSDAWLALSPPVKPAPVPPDMPREPDSAAPP